VRGQHVLRSPATGGRIRHVTHQCSHVSPKKTCMRNGKQHTAWRRPRKTPLFLVLHRSPNATTHPPKTTFYPWPTHARTYTAHAHCNMHAHCNTHAQSQACTPQHACTAENWLLTPAPCGCTVCSCTNCHNSVRGPAVESTLHTPTFLGTSIPYLRLSG
jgi:hypothetical protein